MLALFVSIGWAGSSDADAPPDPTNTTLVVDASGQNISVLSSDTLQTLGQFETLDPIAGAPQFSPDGRYAFVVSRRGWVQKYDIRARQLAGRVRAGIESRNLTISHDGKWLAVANQQPNTLTLLSAADLSIVKTYEIVGKDGTPSSVSAVYLAPPRESFVLALSDVPEIREVFYGPNPPFHGFVHDYRVEGPPDPEPFPMRRIMVPEKLHDFNFDPTFEYLMGASHDGNSAMAIDLVIGLKWTDLDLSDEPKFGLSVTWKQGENTLAAIPHQQENTVSIVNMKSWKTEKQIETAGRGHSLTSSPNSPFIWASGFAGSHQDALQIIDKQSLEIIKVLRPVPGWAVNKVELVKSGQLALVSVRNENGAIVVYDTETLKEVRRLAIANPAGLFNVGE